jgi:hypothetical protein
MGGAVFSGVINGRATAWMMIGMLVFAVAWEAFTNYLERRFEENKAHSEILSKVYKELMILGFIAFALIMGKEVGLIAWSNETLHCFEFCDLLVSICVLVYVGNCAISSFTMHTAQREWDRIALTMTAEVIEDVESHLEKVRQSSFEQLKAKLPFSADWRSDADFKVLQLLFQTKFHLPLTFDYVMCEYLFPWASQRARCQLASHAASQPAMQPAAQPASQPADHVTRRCRYQTCA